MWARLTELGFGIWLFASPFAFGYSSSSLELWLTDALSGALLVVVTVLSFRDPSRRYYLAVPVLGAWLIGSAVLSGPHPIPPPRQNHIMVGFIIMMLGIVPNQALRPPEKWRAFEGGRVEEEARGGSGGADGARELVSLKDTDGGEHQREHDGAEEETRGAET